MGPEAAEAEARPRLELLVRVALLVLMISSRDMSRAEAMAKI